MSEARTYRLAPPDRTGWILGMAGAQVLTLGATVVAAIVALNSGVAFRFAVAPAAIGLVVALGRWGGLPLIDWVVPALRWARGRRGDRRRWLAPLTPMGMAPADTPALPPALGAQVLLSVAAGPGAAAVGVVHDTTADTFAATLRVSGRQFALVERADQDRLLALWGDALAPLCVERGPVVGLRWAEWAAPAGTEHQHAYLAEHGIDDADDPAVVSYRQLLRSAAPVATRHEVLVTLSVASERVKVPNRRRGTDGAGIVVEVLLEQLRLFAARLEAAGLVVSAPLSPCELGRALRVRLDPTVMATLDRRGRSLAERAGRVAPADAGPLATSCAWDHWRVDGSLHRAFWFRDWPRADVGASWMGDLLLYGGAVRTVAVCYQPVPPRISQRTISRQAAKLESDAEHRRKTGFRVGAPHRRAHRAVEEREEELVAGYPEFEYVGLVAVSAPDTDALERACAEVVSLSAGCGIELRALDGRHDAALGACLPLARGLAPRLLTA